MATEGLVERERLSDRERQVLEHLEARADSIPAKANGLEPHAYFSHLFAELPKATAVDHFEYYNVRISGRCKMKRLGLIGGISWVSTIDYYRYINEGINEQLGGLEFAECLIYSLNLMIFSEMAGMIWTKRTV
jgi:hypothetical protein